MAKFWNFFSNTPERKSPKGRPVLLVLVVRQQSVSAALARGFGYELGVENIPDL
jgi:hypothetical protein